MDVCLCAYIHIHAHADVCVFVYACLCTCVSSSEYVCMCLIAICMHIHMHTHTWYTDAFKYSYTHTHNSINTCAHTHHLWCQGPKSQACCSWIRSWLEYIHTNKHAHTDITYDARGQGLKRAAGGCIHGFSDDEGLLIDALIPQRHTNAQCLCVR